MEQLQQYWQQYLISNAIALVVLLLAWKKPLAARICLAVIFVAASIVNACLAITNPTDYLNYGPLAVLDSYRNFIDGWFAEHTGLVVLTIAAGQLLVGLGMFAKNPLFRVAIIGIIIFGLAIAPLGIGSAFPCSLLLAVASIMLWNRPIHGSTGNGLRSEC